jgi:Protein of unknown function (DUF1553)/Protein of unknown function (DUF1549)/Planctomycete cytochrome C
MSLNPVFLAAVVLVAAEPARPDRRFDAKAVEFFEKKVRPVLVSNCYTCHSANTNAKGGLRVDDRNGLIQGGNGGSAVVPGHPENSLLIKAVAQSDQDLKMPPQKRLSAQQVADLAQWIKDGAGWPEVGQAAPASYMPSTKYERLRKEHWSWQPLKETRPPVVHDVSWARADIDRFILAKLEEKGLKPARDADQRTLIRRVTFDLAGLPLTIEEISAFLDDRSEAAFEKVVDRLLASPAFGERWGRHWLDVARYGESTGPSRNVPYPHAWRYRDYVVDAFTRDKPYDQFIVEQIAGDLLPSNSPKERAERLVATGFLALGVKDVNQRFKVRFIMDNIDEQIDTVSRAVLAVTASCARCHDHKFDPISTSEYYALAGIFHSTDLCAGVRNKMGGAGLDYYDPEMLVRLGPDPSSDPKNAKKIEETKKALETARAEFESLRDNPEGGVPGPDGRPKRAIARQKMNKLQNQLSVLTDPAANGAELALGVREARTVGDTEVRVRGEAEKLGQSVPRGFLKIVEFPSQPKVNPKQSGRLELAQWLTSEKNPLTSRVMANRVWQHLFGQGFVRSVDNFGVTGDPPSHPELLDHLARQFIRDDWSVKRLVRNVVLTRAYQLDSEVLEANFAVDPDNRLIWRHVPRRLDAEEIRDATLAASGKLDLARPDGSPAKDLKVIELPNNGPLARRLGDEARASLHRSLYLPLLRDLTPTSLEVFDFAQQAMVTGSRETTTVATQALYALNDPFVMRQSVALAERVLLGSEVDDIARVNLAYRLALNRGATTAEISRVQTYLYDYETAAREMLASTPKPAVVPARGDAPSTPAADPSATATASSRASRQAEGLATKADEKAKGRPATTPRTPAAPLNPDEAELVDEPPTEESILPTDPRRAAWTSFCQALFGSAEFPYVK